MQFEGVANDCSFNYKHTKMKTTFLFLIITLLFPHDTARRRTCVLTCSSFISRSIQSAGNAAICASLFLSVTKTTYAAVVTPSPYSYSSTTIRSIPSFMIITAFDSADDGIQRLKNGLLQLNYLLDNWEEKTTYCNFGEVQRDLLATENRQKLMKAAAETGLLDYDKSATMNVRCRQDPEMVRAFVGLKDDNPTLRNADALLKKPTTLQRVSSDNFEQYIDAVESYVGAVSEVGSLSYEARTDFLTQETNTKEELTLRRNEGHSDNYLDQSRVAVRNARDSLQIIVKILGL